MRPERGCVADQPQQCPNRKTPSNFSNVSVLAKLL
jgi:hypothetical protein